MIATQIDLRSAFEKAKGAVNGAAETVQATTGSVAAAIEDSRGPAEYWIS